MSLTVTLPFAFQLTKSGAGVTGKAGSLTLTVKKSTRATSTTVTTVTTGGAITVGSAAETTGGCYVAYVSGLDPAADYTVVAHYTGTASDVDNVDVPSFNSEFSAAIAAGALPQAAAGASGGASVLDANLLVASNEKRLNGAVIPDDGAGHAVWAQRTITGSSSTATNLIFSAAGTFYRGMWLSHPSLGEAQVATTVIAGTAVPVTAGLSDNPTATDVVTFCNLITPLAGSDGKTPISTDAQDLSTTLKVLAQAIASSAIGVDQLSPDLMQILSRRITATGVTSPVTADTYKLKGFYGDTLYYKSTTLGTPVFAWTDGAAWYLTTTNPGTATGNYFKTGNGATVTGPYTAQGSATGTPAIAAHGNSVLSGFQPDIPLTSQRVANLDNLDAAISTREASSDSRLAHLDADISSRFASGSYVAPDNASIQGASSAATTAASNASTAASAANAASAAATTAASSASSAASNTSSLPAMIVADQFTASALANAPGSLGTGADRCTMNLKDQSANPIADMRVWITSDSVGSDVVAGYLLTNSQGNVTFLLDDGVGYYLWARKDGENPILGQSFTANKD